MTRIEQLLLGAALLAAMMACGSEAVEPTTDGSFEADLTFLSQYVDTVVLEQGDARVAVVPAWQGRVMTSTASGKRMAKIAPASMPTKTITGWLLLAFEQF